MTTRRRNATAPRKVTTAARLEVWVTDDHVSIQEPLAFDRVSKGIDIPHEQLSAVITALQKAVSDG